MSIENPLADPGSVPEEEPRSQLEQESEQHAEREPVSYEQALEAAKSLAVARVEDPLDLEPEDSETQAAQDTIAEWERANGLHMRGVDTVEKAQNIVRAATIWLDAGYSGSEVVRDASDRLSSEHVDALREGNEEVTGILAAAIEDIERRFAPSEKEKKMAEFWEKLTEGERLIAEGRFISAIGTLWGTLTDPFFKRRENRTMTAELRGKIETATAVAQKGYDEQRARRIAGKP